MGQQGAFSNGAMHCQWTLFAKNELTSGKSQIRVRFRDRVFSIIA